MNPEQWLTQHELAIRVGSFAAVFLSIAVWELLRPCRRLLLSRRRRWPANLGILVLNSLVLRLLFPTAAVGIAISVEAQGWGLFNLVALPAFLNVSLSVVLMDLALYLQHISMHVLPLLWRLHRVHHADLDFDVTTGGRFHPIEIVLSMLIKAAVIVVLGPPIIAVVAFELILNVTSMFNHGNVCLPKRLDRALRWLLVTPNMHRVHHSISRHETNSNYGFNLPWWDRLFGTYRVTAALDDRAMTIGIEDYREPTQVIAIRGMLLLPFSAVGQRQRTRRDRGQTGKE